MRRQPTAEEVYGAVKDLSKTDPPPEDADDLLDLLRSTAPSSWADGPAPLVVIEGPAPTMQRTDAQLITEPAGEVKSGARCRGQELKEREEHDKQMETQSFRDILFVEFFAGTGVLTTAVE